MITFRGGCLCQAVRYETTAEPLNQRVCHCHECQKAIGAAFNARVLMRIDDVSITGPINTYYSSETLERGLVHIVVQVCFLDVLPLVLLA
ncbi:GFA family protein [Marinomonas sp. KJ51-3]|uniref:GFA family protein n=1 Tax=Marinomonas rhodophyticola TaxID=2992803 RepID=A0ABT3KI56_9GAMM|nr:GFA family protein [Marinomonas sp. KJ51-3]MCW4629762.1 GFA family protein [Marinomonas sp. KJ51-3]